MSTIGLEVVTFNPLASLPRVWTSVSGKFNGAFISFRGFISREHRMPTFQNANFIFIVSSLLVYLQVKSQGNGNNSPFQTHPKTTTVAVTSLLLYGLAYDAEQRFSSTHPNLANAARRGATIFGSLLMASLASTLLPNWVAPILYLVYILVYAEELMDWLQRRFFVAEIEEINTLPV